VTGECSSGNIYIDEVRGEVICADTGEILGTLVDYGKEWREFGDSSTSRVRSGPPLVESVHDRGLATSIGRGGPSRYSVHLSKINRRLRVRGKRRYVKALQMVREEGRKLGLPQTVISTASHLIRRPVLSGLGRGEMLRSYVLASLYLACRINRVPRSFSEFIKHIIAEEKRSPGSDVITVKKLRYAYRRIIEANKESEGTEIRLSIHRPQDYVNFVSKSLNLSQETTVLMHRICRAAERLKIVHGKSPTSMIAAIAYVASSIMGEKRRQKDIAEVFGTFTDVAIRNRYRELIDKLYIEVIL